MLYEILKKIKKIFLNYFFHLKKREGEWKKIIRKFLILDEY